jgi:ADP-heptose:LPS heptosyltransferase
MDVFVRDLDLRTASPRSLRAMAFQAKISGRFDLAGALFVLSREPAPRRVDASLPHDPDRGWLSAAIDKALGDREGLFPPTAWDIVHDSLAPDLVAALGAPSAGRPSLQRRLWSRIRRQKYHIVGLGAGRVQRPQGQLPVLRRIDFVRVISAGPATRLRVCIDDVTVGEAEGVEVDAANTAADPIGWIFNCWMDLSGVTRGPHQLQLHFERRGGRTVSGKETVFVDPSAGRESSSCSSVNLPRSLDGGSIDDQIRSLPSAVFEAKRSPFSGPLKSILVIRADQLGDICQSLNGMGMLRAAFPGARLEALIAPGNLDLVRSVGIFDDIHTVELTHDPVAQRRYCAVAEQARLKALFAPRGYDLAVDLSPGFETQNLMLLANARNTAGFKPDRFKWMTFGADIHTHDPINQREAAPHSAMIDSFVASLIAMANHRALVLPRPKPDWAMLEPLGIGVGERYVVLHAGARLELVRWPMANFAELAVSLTRDGVKTVLLADDAEALARADCSGAVAGLLYTSAARLPFETLDVLLSHCAAFVGNDTGPKHLAALRGAAVISMHTGRHNWSEWGQDAGGVIVARRVPCVGCGIEDPQLCGKGLACLVDIKPGEMLDQVRKVLAQADVGPIHER